MERKIARDVLSLLDDWCESGVDRVGPETLKLFRDCSRLLGMPAKFHRGTNASNFKRKARALKGKRVSASHALSRALLRSRELEDAGNLLAAMRALERLKHRTDAPFYLTIARHEVARLRLLLGSV